MRGLLWNQEWLGSNSGRSYPLSEEASKTDETGAFTVPDSLLLELFLPVHAGQDIEAERFFLRSLAFFGAGLSLTIAYDDGGDYVTVATAVVATATHQEYASYLLAGVGDFDDSAGKVVIGKLDELGALPPGQYFFTPDAGRLDVDCIRPMLRGVSGVVLVNGNERSERLVGDIELVAGTNVRLTPIVVAGANPQIRVDAVQGEGLNDACVCTDEPGPCIRTVNGVSPDNDGNLDLIGNECLQVEPAENGLRLEDLCSKPCCGCPELEAITNSLEQFGAAQTTLSNFVNRLDAEVSQMSLTVLGSRLGDRSCMNCEDAESDS